MNLMQFAVIVFTAVTVGGFWAGWASEGVPVLDVEEESRPVEIVL